MSQFDTDEISDCDPCSLDIERMYCWSSKSLAHAMPAKTGCSELDSVSGCQCNMLIDAEGASFDVMALSGETYRVQIPFKDNSGGAMIPSCPADDWELPLAKFVADQHPDVTDLGDLTVFDLFLMGVPGDKSSLGSTMPTLKINTVNAQYLKFMLDQGILVPICSGARPTSVYVQLNYTAGPPDPATDGNLGPEMVPPATSATSATSSTPAVHHSTETLRVECDGCYTRCMPYDPKNGEHWGYCASSHCNAPVSERKRSAILNEVPGQGPPAKHARGEQAAL
jgi:hypothetical protein